jgi:nitrite reductase (NADH) small subunit
VGGTPGRPAVEEGSPVIRCPWHSWEYGLRDGICVSNPSLRVRSYPVAVRDGRVFIDMGRARK